jgi:hypothetical protein
MYIILGLVSPLFHALGTKRTLLVLSWDSRVVPVVDVSFLHTLTITRSSISPSQTPIRFSSELRFTHPPHVLIPTLKTHLRVQVLQGGNEVYGRLEFWESLDHSLCRLRTGLFGLVGILAWWNGLGVGLVPVHSFSIDPATSIKVQFIGISA